jgi:hypothetical protein
LRPRKTGFPNVANPKRQKECSRRKKNQKRIEKGMNKGRGKWERRYWGPTKRNEETLETFLLKKKDKFCNEIITKLTASLPIQT